MTSHQHQNSHHFLHINCQSIVNDTKKLQLQNFIKKYEAKIIGLNETFLQPQHSFEIENFEIVRSDRSQKRGGGTALCVHQSIKFEQIMIPDNRQGSAVGIQIKINNNKDLAIFAVYCSPSEPINENLFEYLKKSYKNIIILGDLNAKSYQWYCNETNARGESLENLLESSKLHVINSEVPTYKRSASVIDLAIISDSVIKYE